MYPWKRDKAQSLPLAKTVPRCLWSALRGGAGRGRGGAVGRLLLTPGLADTLPNLHLAGPGAPGNPAVDWLGLPTPPSLPSKK